MSQEKQIAEYLKQGNTITPLEALRLFKCWALSSRIAELNKRGYAIQSKMVKVGKKRVAQYSLNTGV